MNRKIYIDYQKCQKDLGFMSPVNKECMLSSPGCVSSYCSIRKVLPVVTSNTNTILRQIISNIGIKHKQTFK